VAVAIAHIYVMRWRKVAIIAGLGLTGLGALPFLIYADSGRPLRIVRDQYIAGRRLVSLRLDVRYIGGYNFNFEDGPPMQLLVGGRWTEPEEFFRGGRDELAFFAPPKGGVCRVNLVYQRPPSRARALEFLIHHTRSRAVQHWAVDRLNKGKVSAPYEDVKVRLRLPTSSHNEGAAPSGGPVAPLANSAPTGGAAIGELSCWPLGPFLRNHAVVENRLALFGGGGHSLVDAGSG
jgi:hypothetical protein